MNELSRDRALVYIVMRNHNALPLTAEALCSLRQLTYPNYRVIVVDDGSNDDSPDEISLHFPEVTLIRSAKYIEYCKSFNIGIREALRNQAQYIFLVNNDTKDFSTNYLEAIVGEFEENRSVGLVGSWCFDYNGGPIWQGVAKEKLGVPMETPTEGFVVKREVFERIGLLNEKLVRYFEDLDFIIRLRSAGYQTRAVSSVSFAHLGGGTSSKQTFVPNYYRVRNVILFMRKHCADKTMKWKVKQFLRYMRVHTDRLKAALRRRDAKSFLMIGGSITLGFMAGLVVRWADNNEL